MGSTVTVSVRLDRRGNEVCVIKEMSNWIVEDAFKSIDLPDFGAAGFDMFLCSDTVMVEATMKARNEIAKDLTRTLLDAMGAGDTRMGYPKGEE